MPTIDMLRTESELFINAYDSVHRELLEAGCTPGVPPTQEQLEKVVAKLGFKDMSALRAAAKQAR